jgi:DNA polymerase-3 subunit beta
MDIRIDRTALLKALYLAQSVADKKGTNPVVASVLLRTEGPGSIICAATDLQTSVVSELPAAVEQEGGLSVSAKHLYDIIRNLSADEVHLRRTENAWADISAGRAHYKLVGISARDFPKLPDHRETTLSEVDANTLADMIGKTLFSVSTDETRHHLSGIYFECDGKHAVMVSTDGHRLSKVERDIGSGPVLEKGIILPRKGVLELRRLLDGVEGTCDIGLASGYLFAKTADVVLSITLVDAQFPPYKQVIPTENSKQIMLPRNLFLETLKRVSLMSSERSWGIRVELSSGTLRLTSDNPDLGEAHEELEIDYEGEDLTVGFNARYFIDVLNEISESEVCLELNGELDPGMVRPKSGSDYLGVVMPMRI